MENDKLKTLCCKDSNDYIDFCKNRDNEFEAKLNIYIETTIDNEIDIDLFEDDFYTENTFDYKKCYECVHDMSNCDDCKNYFKLED